MKGLKICKRCGKKIMITDKAVMLMTFQGDKTQEKVFWHWQCYLDWRDESISHRAMITYKETLQKIMPQTKEFINHARQQFTEPIAAR
jgi:hypothetical protein